MQETKIPKNTIVEVIERKNNWVRVQIEENNSCLNGWIEELKIKNC
ncbi:SH3 domain-containing protein [Lysinibacillus capsici]